MPETTGASTRAVHAGERRPGPEGSLVYPIYQSTVFTPRPGDAYDDLRYLRLSTAPSQVYLHDKLAALEESPAAVATASGMAAITTTLHALLSTGDHLLAATGLYGGTHAFLTAHAARLGWTVSFVDPTRPDTWEAARTPRTRVFLLESVSNPLVRVARLPEAVSFARAHGITTVVDNTFASPVNLRPRTLGVDVVVHSATKYLNGHSDLVAGAVMGDEELVTRIRQTLNHYGGTLDAHAGFLLARGVKTLAVRVRAQNANALALARFLHDHPRVAEVHYPGLPDHPDHEVASRLMSGYGGMLSFRPTGGAAVAAAVVERTRLAYSAPSLGGVETLITRPVVTSHASMDPAERARLGITDDLIRVSCGIEDTEDLVADLEQALASADA